MSRSIYCCSLGDLSSWLTTVRQCDRCPKPGTLRIILPNLDLTKPRGPAETPLSTLEAKPLSSRRSMRKITLRKFFSFDPLVLAQIIGLHARLVNALRLRAPLSHSRTVQKDEIHSTVQSNILTEKWWTTQFTAQFIFPRHSTIHLFRRTIKRTDSLTSRSNDARDSDKQDEN